MARRGRLSVLGEGKGVPQREETVTQTFRIKSCYIDTLREEARSKGYSLNTLLNILLQRWVEWERHLSKFDVMPVSKACFKRLLSAIDDGFLLEEGERMGSSAFTDFVFILTKSNDIDAYFEVLRKMCHSHGFVFETITEGHGVSFIIRHGMGRKYSKFFQGVVQGAFSRFGAKFDCETSEDSVRFIVRTVEPNYERYWQLLAGTNIISP